MSTRLNPLSATPLPLSQYCYVPDVIPELSTEQVLTSEWVPGVHIDKVRPVWATDEPRGRAGDIDAVLVGKPGAPACSRLVMSKQSIAACLLPVAPLPRTTACFKLCPQPCLSACRRWRT